MSENKIQASLEVTVGTSQKEIEKLLETYNFSVLDSSQNSCCGASPTETYLLEGPEEKYQELEKAVLQTRYTFSLQKIENSSEYSHSPHESACHGFLGSSVDLHTQNKCGGFGRKCC